MKISVQRGITVSWHDNLLFKCTAALFPPPWSTADSSYIIIECLFSFLTPSFSMSHPLNPPPPPSPCHSLQLECLSVKTSLCSATGPANSIGQQVIVQVWASVSAIVFLFECGCTCIHFCFVCVHVPVCGLWWMNQKGSITVTVLRWGSFFKHLILCVIWLMIMAMHFKTALYWHYSLSFNANLGQPG